MSQFDSSIKTVDAQVYHASTEEQSGNLLPGYAVAESIASILVDNKPVLVKNCTTGSFARESIGTLEMFQSLFGVTSANAVVIHGMYMRAF